MCQYIWSSIRRNISAVEASETFVLVLYGVAVHYVHNHGYASRMCGVHQCLELLGRAETARRSEEVADMVAERAVIRVFLNGHNLYGVIAVGCDARQHEFAELVVGAHAFALLRHAYVAFVYEQGLGVGHEIVVLPFVGAVGMPYLRREYGCLFVLDYACGVGRDALARASGPAYYHFVKLAVADVVGCETEFPHSVVVNACGSVFQLLLPPGKVACEHKRGGVRRPFAEHPATVGAAVEAEIVMGVGEICQ